MTHPKQPKLLELNISNSLCIPLAVNDDILSLFPWSQEFHY